MCIKIKAEGGTFAFSFVFKFSFDETFLLQKKSFEPTNKGVAAARLRPLGYLRVHSKGNIGPFKYFCFGICKTSLQSFQANHLLGWKDWSCLSICSSYMQPSHLFS